MKKIKKGSDLVTDGAKAYPSLSKTYQLKHEEVNYAAGEFVRLKRRGPKPALSMHTRGIDCTWKKIKDKLPPGIHTRKKGKINKDQQSTAGTACCERTAKQLKSKGRCEGRKWSWPTKGSKTVVKRDFFKTSCWFWAILLSLKKHNFRWRAQGIATFNVENTVLLTPPHEFIMLTGNRNCLIYINWPRW